MLLRLRLQNLDTRVLWNWTKPFKPHKANRSKPKFKISWLKLKDNNYKASDLGFIPSIFRTNLPKVALTFKDSYKKQSMQNNGYLVFLEIHHWWKIHRIKPQITWVFDKIADLYDRPSLLSIDVWAWIFKI